MGKSRSATIVCAYLMYRYQLTPLDALNQIRESRGVCEPNSGFMQQLQLYFVMNTPADVESQPVYQRWQYQREVDLSRAAGLAPEPEKIRFEDEHPAHKHPTAPADASVELRCRKCRLVCCDFDNGVTGTD